MNTIILKNADQITLQLAPEAVVEKNRLLSLSSHITGISGDLIHQRVIDVMRSLKSALNQVEVHRNEVKTPIREAGATIDTMAKNFVADLKLEYNRLQAMTSIYETQKRVEAERLEKERLQKIADDLAIEAKKKKEEQDRLDELERKANELKTKKARDANLKKLEEEKLAQANREAEKATAPVAIAPRPVKIEGQVVRESWNFEVTDLELLVKHHPQFVTFTPKVAEIKRFLNGCDGENPLMGIKAFKETKVGVRV